MAAPAAESSAETIKAVEPEPDQQVTASVPLVLGGTQVNVEVKGPNPWLPLVILGVLTGVLGIWMMVSAIAGTKLSLGVITLMLALGLFLSGLSELA